MVSNNHEKLDRTLGVNIQHQKYEVTVALFFNSFICFFFLYNEVNICDVDAGTMAQLFDVGQAECSVLFLWTYLVAALALTVWSSVFMWILS